MYDVQGRWALITGAARGIGYLSAKFMAEQGCNLILHSRDLAHTEKVLAEVRSRGVAADDLAAVERMLQEIDDLGVDVDIVMNNAGLQIAYRMEWCGTPAEDYEVSFRVNTIAPAMICYHFLPKMMKKGTGRILNTTSGIALDVCQAGYSASKAALDKITIVEGGGHGRADQPDGSGLVPDGPGRGPGAERAGERHPGHHGRRVCKRRKERQIPGRPELRRHDAGGRGEKGGSGVRQPLRKMIGASYGLQPIRRLRV